MLAKERRLCLCSRCGYQWMQKTATRNPPEKCARATCRSTLWATPRRAATAKGPGRPPSPRNEKGELIAKKKSATLKGPTK